MTLRVNHEPGRFHRMLLLEIALFDRAGDFGTCDDGIIGEPDGPHYTRLDGPFRDVYYCDYADMPIPLNTDELAYLRSLAGCIIFESGDDDNGEVVVTCYGELEALDEEWDSTTDREHIATDDERSYGPKR